MGRRKQSLVEDVMEITSRLPWWVGVTCSLISYLILHWYATQEVQITHGANILGAVAVSGLFHGLALFAQYLFPAVFLVGAFLSTVKNFKRKMLYNKTGNNVSLDSLNDMSWRDFEFLVGEYFRHRGFNVEETKTGADDGIDLIAQKDNEKYLIQCKQWKAYKVGVKVVRELFGVTVAAEATGGVVATSGRFTQDAISFAKANNIQLLDGRELLERIKSDVNLENRPDTNTDKVLRKGKWVFVFILGVGICVSAFHFDHTDTSLYSSLSAQVKRLFPDFPEYILSKYSQIHESKKKGEIKDISFTDKQVKEAMANVLNQNRRKLFDINKRALESEGEHYSYEIELITGVWIYTDNAMTGGGKVTYKSANGIVVSLDKTEVKSIKKRKIDE